MAGIGEFAVDLVGDDEDPVLQADPADALHLLAGPHAPGGVVRVAQEHDRGLRIRGLP